MTWKSVGITLGLGGVFLAGMVYWKSIKDAGWLYAESGSNSVKGVTLSAIEKEKVKTIGKASLGGEWELVDSTGKVRTDKDFHGQWILLYFGFTHCPDVCPEELEKIVEAVDLIGRFEVLFLRFILLSFSQMREKTFRICSRFSSRWTQREIPRKLWPNTLPVCHWCFMHEGFHFFGGFFSPEFSPKLIGMTGSVAQIEKVTRAFRVFFSAGPKDDDNDYIVSFA